MIKQKQNNQGAEMNDKSKIEIYPIDLKVYEVISQVKEINEKIIAQNSEILKQNFIMLETLAMPKFWLNNNISSKTMEKE